MARLGTTPGTVPTPPARRGRTRVAHRVVGAIATLAAQDVVGVARYGPGARLRGEPVHVRVEDDTAVIRIDLVATTDRAVHETAADLRLRVVEAVEGMTGLSVTRVDVTVVDLVDHTPDLTTPIPGGHR